MSSRAGCQVPELCKRSYFLEEEFCFFYIVGGGDKYNWAKSSYFVFLKEGLFCNRNSALNFFFTGEAENAVL